MFTGYNWLRLVRLLAGGIALYQGIISYNTILGALGVLLLIQGIFNIGCPGVTCNPTYKQTTLSKAEEIKFEEVK